VRATYVLLVVSTLAFLSSSSELAFLKSYGLAFAVLDLRITEPLLILMYSFSLFEIFGLTKLWHVLTTRAANHGF
jgi:hypothetical protein